MEQRLAERTHKAQKSLGGQKHSRLDRPMIPGQSEHFVIDEIKKHVERTRND